MKEKISYNDQSQIIRLPTPFRLTLWSWWNSTRYDECCDTAARFKIQDCLFINMLYRLFAENNKSDYNDLMEEGGGGGPTLWREGRNQQKSRNRVFPRQQSDDDDDDQTNNYKITTMMISTTPLRRKMQFHFFITTTTTHYNVHDCKDVEIHRNRTICNIELNIKIISHNSDLLMSSPPTSLPTQSPSPSALRTPRRQVKNSPADFGSSSRVRPEVALKTYPTVI